MDYLTMLANTENQCKQQQQEHWSQANSHIAGSIKALLAAAIIKASTIIVIEQQEHWSQANSHVAGSIKAWLAAAYHKSQHNHCHWQRGANWWYTSHEHQSTVYLIQSGNTEARLTIYDGVSFLPITFETWIPSWNALGISLSSG